MKILKNKRRKHLLFRYIKILSQRYRILRQPIDKIKSIILSYKHANFSIGNPGLTL